MQRNRTEQPPFPQWDGPIFPKWEGPILPKFDPFEPSAL